MTKGDKMSKAELLRTGNGGAITVETEIDDTNKDSLNPPSTKAIMEKVGGGGGVTLTFADNCASLSQKSLTVYFVDGTSKEFAPAQMVGQVKGVVFIKSEGDTYIGDGYYLKFGASSILPEYGSQNGKLVSIGTFPLFPLVDFKIIKVEKD